MNLPDDLSEGWWWCGDAEGDSLALYIRAERGDWWIGSEGCWLWQILPDLIRMERVAAPSWERGDG